MSMGQFHKHHFLYIEENLFTQLMAQYQLADEDLQNQFIENYVKLLKEFGGQIRKATHNLTQRPQISNETLCELASTTAPVITESMLIGETLDIKDKYSCPTPTLVLAAFIAASGRAVVSDSAQQKSPVLTLFKACVEYLEPIYQSQLKLSA